MMQNFENIDRLFNEQLHDFSEKPRPEVWNNISERIGHNKKRKKILFITRVAAGVALLLSLSIAINYFLADKTFDNQKNITKNNIIPDNNKIDNANPNKSVEEPATSSGSVIADNFNPVKREKPSINTNEIDAQEETFITIDSAVYFDNQTESINYLSSSDLIEPKYSVIENENPLLDSNFIQEQVLSSYDSSVLLALSGNEKDFIEDEVKEKKEGKWLIGGQFGPMYTDDIFSSSSQPVVSEQINSKEKGIVSYAGGINISYSLGKRLSVESGIQYSKYGKDLNDINVVSEVNRNSYSEVNQPVLTESEDKYLIVISNSAGNIRQKDGHSTPYYSLETPASQQNLIAVDKVPNTATRYFEYVEVPITVKYKLIDRKIDFSLSTGLSANMLIAAKMDIEGEEYKIDNVNEYKYNYMAGIGLEYPILNNFIFNIEPKFRYSLNTLYKDSYELHPYSFGILSGIIYRF